MAVVFGAKNVQDCNKTYDGTAPVILMALFTAGGMS